MIFFYVFYHPAYFKEYLKFQTICSLKRWTVYFFYGKRVQNHARWMVYKSSNNQAPVLFAFIVLMVSQEDKSNNQQPHKRLKSLYPHKAFSLLGPKYWNTLHYNSMQWTPHLSHFMGKSGLGCSSQINSFFDLCSVFFRVNSDIGFMCVSAVVTCQYIYLLSQK